MAPNEVLVILVTRGYFKVKQQGTKQFKNKQAEVQQCLAQHIVARLSLNCVYVVARIMVRL